MEEEQRREPLCLDAALNERLNSFGAAALAAPPFGSGCTHLKVCDRRAC